MTRFEGRSGFIPDRFFPDVGRKTRPTTMAGNVTVSREAQQGREAFPQSRYVFLLYTEPAVEAYYPLESADVHIERVEAGTLRSNTKKTRQSFT